MEECTYTLTLTAGEAHAVGHAIMAKIREIRESGNDCPASNDLLERLYNAYNALDNAKEN